MFGSDWPALTPDRWMADFAKMPFKDEVRPLILRENVDLYGGFNPGRWTRDIQANASTLDGLTTRPVVLAADGGLSFEGEGANRGLHTTVRWRRR